jgi:hypothetical protein
MKPAKTQFLVALLTLFLPLLPIEASGVRVTVDISQGKLVVKKGLKVLDRFEVETSRYGIGKQIHSLKTPTGSFTLKKEPGHRFGRVYRLSGYQGNARGILIHVDLTKGHGSNGCIHLMSSAEMSRLWSILPSGANLKIRR